MPPFPPPEIAAADLAGLALELALWGAGDPAALAFLTPPPAPALSEARALLYTLGALDEAARITPHGRALARLPLHPRLAQMLVLGDGAPACALAALLQARDPLRGERGPPPVDLALRLRALDDPARVEAEAPVYVARAALAAIRAEARRLRALAPGGPAPPREPGALLSLAYPDRIGQRREGAAPRYLLAGGKGAVLPEADPMGTAPLIVAADLDGDPREARVRRALVLDRGDLRTLHAARLRFEEVCAWSRRDRAVVARRRVMLGALALEDRPWQDAPPEAVAAALVDGVRDLGLEILPWTTAAQRLAARAEWLRAQGTDLPDLSLAGLAAELDAWLAPHLTGMRRVEDLAGLDLLGALEAWLGPAVRHDLDRLAPPEIAAPTGTRLKLDYAGSMPRAAVRLQEMFGVDRHPTLGPSRVPVTLDLLSPAGRPVQTTADLPGFWASSYAEVRRALRGRYPRHPWPEDPLQAAPTRRAKPRGT